MYLRHGLRRPNAAGVWGVGHGTQNTSLACAHSILTTATLFCALFPPPAALANVPLSTREPWTYGAKNSRRRSRFAARRTAGTSNRSRQPTGDLRPPSPGERPRKGAPLPGFRRSRRKESKSFFAAACTWRKILLRPQVWKMAAPLGRPFYARSRPALSFAQGSFAALGEEISR